MRARESKHLLELAAKLMQVQLAALKVPGDSWRVL